jgi:hypothetical protein
MKKQLRPKIPTGLSPAVELFDRAYAYIRENY